jgi:hypothetical protein
MQPGVADRLADDDPIAGPIRRRPIERFEDDFGTVQAPELILGFPRQGVQLDALGVGERLDVVLHPVAIYAPALDRLPLCDDPGAGFGLGRVLVNERIAVVGVEPRPNAPFTQLLGRPGLPFGLLAHGGLHVDARLDRLGFSERVAIGDRLELAMIAEQHDDGSPRDRGQGHGRLCAPGRPASHLRSRRQHHAVFHSQITSPSMRLFTQPLTGHDRNL